MFNLYLSVFSGFFDNKTDHHDITEILLKVALNTINQTKPHVSKMSTLTCNWMSSIVINKAES
jgi:hypothetical protein